MIRLLAIIIIGLWAAGCSPSGGASVPSPQIWAAASPEFVERREENQEAVKSVQATYSKAQLDKALRVASQMLINRDPRAEEVAKVSDEGFSGYEQVVKAYLDGDEFKTAQIVYHRTLFEMGGTMNAINYNEPANLATYLITQDKDFREVLTADYCVNDMLQVGPCSSFPNAADAKTQAAGALTTQAFLQKWEAPFNFRRAAKAFKVFACREYPDTTDIGLAETEISEKVKTFACKDCNPACYTCHNNLNSRAALFYRFDRKGFYNTNPSTRVADGLITVTDTNTASTVKDLLKDNVVSRYHGKEIKSLREYGSLLSQNRLFRDCLAQKLTNHMMARKPYDPMLPAFQSIRDNVGMNDFKVKAILLEIAKHPAFVKR